MFFFLVRITELQFYHPVVTKSFQNVTEKLVSIMYTILLLSLSVVSVLHLVDMFHFELNIRVVMSYVYMFLPLVVC